MSAYSIIEVDGVKVVKLFDNSDIAAVDPFRGLATAGWGYDAGSLLWKPMPVKTVSGNVLVPVDISGVTANTPTYRPAIIFDKTDYAIGTTDTLIRTINFTGKLDQIYFDLEDKAIEVMVEIDGVACIRVDGDDLLNVWESTTFQQSVYESQTDKKFMFVWKTPVDVSTSVKLYGKKAAPSKLIKNHSVAYRIQTN